MKPYTLLRVVAVACALSGPARADDADNAVMRSVASKLSELELKAVSAYISGLE